MFSSGPLVLWVVGEPGAGKTVLCRQILQTAGQPFQLLPQPKWTRAGRYVAAGHYNGERFEGADRVPYNGVRDALEAWREVLCKQGAPTLTLFDGDRFSHGAVVQFFTALPVRLGCALLDTPAEVAEQRRLARGSKQNPAWVRGRRTKAMRFFEAFPGDRARLPLDQHTPEGVLRAMTSVEEAR